MSAFTENWLPNIVTDVAMFIVAMYYGPEKARESMDRLVQKVAGRRSANVTITPYSGTITIGGFDRPRIFVSGTPDELQRIGRMLNGCDASYRNTALLDSPKQ